MPFQSNPRTVQGAQNRRQRGPRGTQRGRLLVVTGRSGIFHAPVSPPSVPDDITLQGLAHAAITAPTSKILRRVDIYEEDGTTLWAGDAPILNGSVSVDSTRDERRSLDLTLDNTSGLFKSTPTGFWYDKVVKVYRGVYVPSIDTDYEAQIGEFIIDSIDNDSFPNQASINGRDYAAKLAGDKFAIATAFVRGNSMGSVIRTIATNGKITKFKIDAAADERFLGREFFFEADTSRWDACHDLATAYGFDIFFDAQGFLVVQEFRDPSLTPPAFTFLTGPSGNIANFKKHTNSSRLYNHVVVVGESGGTATVWAEATNNDPASPSSVGNLGYRRTYRFSSPFITEKDQAQAVADRFLGIHSLEEYSADLDTLVFPWLEAADIVEFVDPDPAPTDPTRYLLSSFSLPLKLETMSADLRRVTIIGNPQDPQPTGENLFAGGDATFEDSTFSWVSFGASATVDRYGGAARNGFWGLRVKSNVDGNILVFPATGGAFQQELDTFTRGDSTTSLGSTSSHTFPWTARVGTWGIGSNQARMVTSGGANIVTVAGAPSGIFEFTLGGTPQDGMGIVWRWGDANNYYYLTRVASFGTWNVIRRLGGVETVIGNTGLSPVAAGDVIRVDHFGDEIDVYGNGILLASFVDNFLTVPFLGGNALCGLYANGALTTSRWDNYKFPPNGVIVDEGSTYRFSGYTKAVTAGRITRLALQWTTPTTTLSKLEGSDVTPVRGDFTRAEVQGEPPIGAVLLAPLVFIYNAKKGEYYYFDDFFVEEMVATL